MTLKASLMDDRFEVTTFEDAIRYYVIYELPVATSEIIDNGDLHVCLKSTTVSVKIATGRLPIVEVSMYYKTKNSDPLLKRQIENLCTLDMRKPNFFDEMNKIFQLANNL